MGKYTHTHAPTRTYTRTTPRSMPFDLFDGWTSVAPHHVVAAVVIGIRKIVVVMYVVCGVVYLSQFVVVKIVISIREKERGGTGFD